MSGHTALAAVTATAVAAMLLAAAHPALHAQPEPSLSEVSLGRLQSMVLHCDLHPRSLNEASFDAAFCAHATEELRQRAFEGDTQRLRSWLRDERARMEVDEGPTDAGTAVPSQALPMPQASDAQLESSFLECDRLSRETVLDAGTASQCSVVYEALKARVFAGDFERLLAWWRTAALPAGGQATVSRAP